MKKLSIIISLLFFIVKNGNSQTPINLSSQPSFTYTENFADINNWIFNVSPSNATFSAGVGSQAWKGIDVATTTPAIPNATRVTAVTNFWQTPGAGSPPTYSGGVYRGTQSMILYSTGTTDNSSSTAMDFFLDFTGVNAGAVSFDWNSINTNTGNRTGSLRVYASVDGINFTEITTAQVLSFVNNTPTSGSIINAALPSYFNGSATARLRFYYHNASGGSAGFRPRLNVDNVKVTAIPTTACIAPTAQPTTLIFNSVLYNSIQLSFTAPATVPQNYLVVMSKNSALTSLPVNNTVYNIGDNLGDGTVVAITNTTSATINSLTNSTQYFFYIFSMNNVCSGGPLYFGTNPLIGNITTLAGPLNCVAPTTQPTNLIFSNITTTGVTGNFTAAANTNEYLVVRSLSSTFTGTLNNGIIYSGGNVLGNGSVVTRTTGTTFTINSLSPGTTYYFYIFGLNSQNCNGGPIYNSINPLTNNATTIALPPCVTPSSQPAQLNLVASNTTVNGYFLASSTADGYLVIRSINNSLSATPVNGTNYTVGSAFGGGTIVANATATAFIDYNLTSSTTYNYFVFAKYSVCSGGSPIYLTSNPLTASATTTAAATSNLYFGNLHAHSFYSDGNKDNPSLIPADDYAYAKNSLCMDFLGISEHNHLTAGMSLSNYQPGLNQAIAATTPAFLALFGMEYGVIANGGHVLIYGSNQLIGWETNNYNVYVPKSDYTGTPETTGSTGLFRTINQMNNNGNSVFASFAHPDFADYNDLANVAYNPLADSAVLGCAVASGPAFSQSTSYNDAPTSMAYIDYYNKMLSKGYHIGPFMDHDTHYTNFGRSSNNRLAVTAPSLTNNNFYAAIKSRNFYATEDCDTRVVLSLNNEKMGSINTGTIAPAISVYAVDPTSPTSIPTIRIMYGILGSGILPVQVANASAYTVSYTDNNLAIGATGYYYADIYIAGNRTITAPIWYTRTAVTPVKLLSFTAFVNNNRTVQLQWKTTNEIDNKMFVVEKSINGNQYIALQNIAAKNDNAAINNYSIIDENPSEGINYYRLKQVDKNGKFTYSNVVAVNLKASNNNAFSLQQNPINNILKLNINSTNTAKATIYITDIFGRILNTQILQLVKGFQTSSINLAALKNGNYQVSLVLDNEMMTQKFVKL